MALLNEAEIRRKALAGIKLSNPTTESQAAYDSYIPLAKQNNTGVVQYPTTPTITNAPTSSNINIGTDMLSEIQRKANAGQTLTNYSPQKQELYNAAKNKAPTYQTYQAAAAPTYNSQYQDKINSVLDELLAKTGNFKYDAATDPLFAQYKESYNREGNRAMTNNMAEATALSGGRMNSAAITAGQQAQNYYNTQLNDKIPELQQQAFAQYMADLAQQQSNIGTMGNLENMMFGQYQTELGQYNTDRNFGYQQTQDQNNYNYQNYRDTQNYDRNVIESDRNYDYNLWGSQNALAQDARNFGYTQERDKVGDSQWEQNFNQSASEFQQNLAYQLARAAASDSQWQQNFNTGNSQWEQQFNYGKERDNVSDIQWDKTYDLNTSKAQNTTTSTSGLSYQKYYDKFEDMLENKKVTLTDTQKEEAQKGVKEAEKVYKQAVEDNILTLVQKGQLSQEQAYSLIVDLGL